MPFTILCDDKELNYCHTNTIPAVLKQSSVKLNQIYTLPGEELKLGDRIIIRGTHTSNTKQWAINFWDNTVSYLSVHFAVTHLTTLRLYISS